MKSKAIAIDGPAYVGKSTISQSLGKLTGYTYINTGHMYRAIGKLALQQKIRTDNYKNLITLAKNIHITFESNEADVKTKVNGEDWTKQLDGYDLVRFASQVALIPEIRDILVEKQRSYANVQPVIMEGRDIGSVVFPNAEWKFFVTASVEVRAKRLYKLLSAEEKKQYPDYTEFISKINEIDEQDTNRKIAPLKISEDAIIYDNSDSPSESQDALILYYYITHGKEIIRNAHFLKGKS